MPSSQPPGGPSPQGLTSAQVRQRVQAGQVNTPPDSPTKSVRRIVLENLFSFFNIIFYVIAGFLIAVGSFEELVFLLVVGANTAIGIIQELHSKKKLDELSLLSAPKATVIRNGTEQTIPTAQLVQDDRILLAAGNQISADAQVVSGSVQVNESLITGESDEITKGPGSTLLSGSFVVSGRCQAVLTHVGADSYASQLTNEAKKSKKSHLPGMMRSLNRLLLAIGILIVPIGGALYYRQTSLLGLSVREGVETTAAAVIGMIPEGLYLMVSLALAASVLRLATKGTLVQDLKCTETLARVDVLCVDKTGTITQPEMAYCGLLPLTTELEETEIEAHLSDFVSNMAPDNETMQALQTALQREDHRKAVQVLGFSSETKYSAVAYSREDCYVLGAPEFILGASGYVPYRSLAEEAMADGSRVLLFAACLPGPEGRGIADARPLAFVRLKNPVRETAKETFAYFHDQGVTVKVISGDNPVTVAAAANEAGIQGADKYVDASTLESYEDIQNACEEYNVFGRVKPNQKKLLVQALQENKHTVAMTGDGVNDALALKEADLGIAMGNAAPATKSIAQVVLVDSKFSHLPDVVARGRQVMANMERVASLFLVKTVYSALISLGVVLTQIPFPYLPRHITYLGALTIGVPAFILALAPNTRRYIPGFLKRVVLFALPGGIAVALSVLLSTWLLPGIMHWDMANAADLTQLRALNAIILFVLGILVLARVAQPLTGWRGLMVLGFTVIGAAGVAIPFVRHFFALIVPRGSTLMATLVVLAVSIAIFLLCVGTARVLAMRRQARRAAKG